MITRTLSLMTQPQVERKMSEQNLSQWFTNGEEPWENGVYQQMCGFRTEVGYQRYEDGEWYAWCKTPEEAAKEKHCIGKSRDKWRGLSTNPEVKKNPQNKRKTMYVVQALWASGLYKAEGSYQNHENAKNHLARLESNKACDDAWIEKIRFRTPE